MSVEVLPAARPDVGKLPVGQRKPRKSKGIVKQSRVHLPKLASEQRPQDSINSASSAPLVQHLSPLAPPLDQAPTNEVTTTDLITQSTQDGVAYADQSSGPRLLNDSQPCQKGPEIATAQNSTPVESSLPNSESESSTRTIWPQQHKLALANAAKNALTSGSINAGKDISAEEIVRLLDQYPSYVKLCGSLEQRGFVIHRRYLAQMLLSAVPGAESNNPALQESNDLAKPSESATELGRGMFDSIVFLWLSAVFDKFHYVGTPQGVSKTTCQPNSQASGPPVKRVKLHHSTGNALSSGYGVLVMKSVFSPLSLRSSIS